MSQALVRTTGIVHPGLRADPCAVYADLPPANVLIADPPWDFDDQLPGAGRGTRKKYKTTMSVDQIKAFALPPIADDCMLFLWRVGGFAREAYDVIDAWGFDYFGAEMCWRKLRLCTPCDGQGWTRTRAKNIVTCPNCRGRGSYRHLGMGWTVRWGHEIVLLARRGRPQRLVADIDTEFEALMPLEAGTRRPLHSAKPAYFFELVARLFGGVRVSLFDRTQRPGFRCFGDELAGDGATL